MTGIARAGSEGGRGVNSGLVSGFVRAYNGNACFH